MTNAELLLKFGRETARVLQAHYELDDILAAMMHARLFGDFGDEWQMVQLYDLRNGLPWDWRIAEEGA